jgi:hypothetical protein
MHPVTSRLPTIVLLLAAASLGAQDAADPWPAFAKLPPARQQAAAAAFLADLPKDPHADALRAFAAEADAPAKPRAKVGAVQRPKRTLEYPREADPLHRRVDYVFGVGTLQPRGAAPTSGGKAKPADGKAADPVVLRQALAGLVPDADKALAALLRRLDVDLAGDDFAAFLHGWRNGDESFYEALDRTAGTEDSVFFYDVMLGDFRVHFGKGDAKVNASLQRAHDALHDAFLAYRQYRGFREAVAWSLALPPDVALPTRLARYEEKAAGGYSLREQVAMAAAAMDHDLGALVDAIAKDAPPLPQPVWAAAYDPYPAWTARFQALQAGMIERAGSTDAFLAKALADRRALAADLRARAAAALAAAAAATPRPR